MGKIEEEFIICTYPRSGSHYLKDLVRQKLGADLRKSHDPFLDFKNKITIVRNPLDSVTSAMVMEHRDPKKYTPERLDSQIELYKIFYSEIVNNFEIIINYEVLKNNPDSVIKYLSEKMNLEIMNKEYVSNLENVKNNFDKYIITCKSKPILYKISKEYFSNQDLVDCWKLYNHALTKKSV